MCEASDKFGLQDFTTTHELKQHDVIVLI